jgi:hypothetical protein
MIIDERRNTDFRNNTMLNSLEVVPYVFQQSKASDILYGGIYSKRQGKGFSDN